MTHNIASIQPCGEFHIGGSTTANEADVRAAIIMPNLSAADLRAAKLYGADLSGANLRAANVNDEEIADCNILYGATMPDGNRYDGRFSLEGDIAFAREEGIKTDDSSAMARWYAGDD